MKSPDNYLITAPCLLLDVADSIYIIMSSEGEQPIYHKEEVANEFNVLVYLSSLLNKNYAEKEEYKTYLALLEHIAYMTVLINGIADVVGLEYNGDDYGDPNSGCDSPRKLADAAISFELLAMLTPEVLGLTDVAYAELLA